jgi:hypothetical protein
MLYCDNTAPYLILPNTEKSTSRYTERMYMYVFRIKIIVRKKYFYLKER